MTAPINPAQIQMPRSLIIRSIFVDGGGMNGVGANVAAIYHSGWDKWIAQNLVRGVARTKLETLMYEKGFDQGLVKTKIDDVYSSPLMDVLRQEHIAHCKVQSLLTTLSRLQDGAVGEHCDVARRADLDAQAFYATYVANNIPVVLHGLVKDWPACQRWSGAYVLQRVGPVNVRISADRLADPHYEDNFERHVTQIRLDEFVHLLSADCPNNYYLCGKHDFLGHVEARVLGSDFWFPEGFIVDGFPRHKAHLWWGAAGTWTPLHHDASNNLLFQVRGSKELYLIAPVHLPRLYNDRECFSDIDPRSVDLKKFPEFAGITIWRARIDPGDVIFLPVGWWHAVEALTESISISCTSLRLPRNANVWSWRNAE